MDSALEVRQHNAITTARYEYSELQLDIFLYLLSILKKDNQNGIYEIVVKDLSAITGKEYRYGYLRKATEEMGSRMFEISTPKRLEQLWMFQRVAYVLGEGRIEVEFANPIKPYLFDLKDNFTSFQLYAALRLGSKYAKRIYALCSQWKDKGQTPTFGLDELKKMLHLLDDKGNEQYKPFSMFKKFVLDESVKQINQRTDLEIGYILQKRGRSFNSVTFTVKPQPLAIVLPLKDQPAKTGSTPTGISDNQYQNTRLLLEKWNIKRADVVNQIMNSAELIQEVNKFAYELQTGKVKVEKNVAGYLLTRLGLKQPLGGPTKGKEKDL
ncbi:replication initiation protein [Spirosoma pollinicola]|uniref:Replication protein RepB n=1 Tax=Spirosoma pollinicola TaxID=2057025 RepID=A0A2K8ZA98_9BACT|nr:replication initiation protein [Spirosoma pollinicola]AUD06775.1 replication protein RepB [Spirosoma pollinicola]